MHISAKVQGDLADLHIKRNQKHDGKEATVDIEIGIKQDESDNWGEDFHDLAFASMCERVSDDGAATLVHLQDTIKPNKRVVYERHKMTIDGSVVRAQPELLALKTVEGEAKVVAKFRVPISTNAKELLGKLMDKVNTVIKVEFEVEQPDLGMPAETQGSLNLPAEDKQPGFTIVPATEAAARDAEATE